MISKPLGRRGWRCEPIGAGVARGALVALGMAIILSPVPKTGVAQELPLKREALSSGEPGSCPALPVPGGRRGAASTAADSLLAEGSRELILGNPEAARDYLRRAVELDPANPVASYRLARTLDEGGEARLAVEEYCRYLSLNPSGADANDIRIRVRQLAETGVPLPEEPWRIPAREGIVAHDRGEYAAAVAAFSRAIELHPNRPDSYYNRAAAHLPLGNIVDALRDLQAYLDLAPSAADGSAVAAAMDRIRGLAADRALPTPRVLTIEPRNALVRGLLLPGFGQYSTGRAGLGVAVLAGVGAAAYLATRSEIRTATQGAHDPFGNYYEYEVRRLERPFQLPGFAAAALIAVAGAAESYLYVRRYEIQSTSTVPAAALSGDSRRFSLELAGDVGSVGFLLTYRPPTPR